jgi:hypothetical protein
VSLVLAFIGIASPVVAIVGSCNPNRGHDNTARYVATTGTVAGVNGISANILELDPFYTAQNGTGTNSTIMLVDSGLAKWAQLGWFKSKINSSQVHREAGLEFYLSSNNNTFQFFGSKQVQTQTWYEILEDSSNFDFFVGGSYVASHSGFTPAGYQMFSETHDLADQMPGVSSNVETFRQSTYWTGANHSTQHTIVGGVGFDSHFYGGQNLGGGTYYAWDRCGTFAAAAPGTGGVTEAASAPSQEPWAPPSAVLSNNDMTDFGIVSASDVTRQNLAAGAKPGWLLSEADALSAAKQEIDVSGESRVYQAVVIPAPGKPAQQAWIVTTPGGVPPFDGPAGAPPVAGARLTGVVLDATTGEFLRGFMH